MSKILRKYNVVPLSVPGIGMTVESYCNDITFINFGDKLQPPSGDSLIVDDVIVVRAGEEYIITGNEGEMNVTNHRVRFEGTTGIRSAVIVRKKYVG